MGVIIGIRTPDMAEPWFTAVERFGPAHGAWSKYIEWSGLNQVEELVSLDTLLCPPVLMDVRDDHWPHIVIEHDYLMLFKDLEVLRRALAASDVKEARLLCVLRDPIGLPILAAELNSFRFVGFDLVDAETGVSALSNCGGWPELDNAELSRWGLITDYHRAAQLQKELLRGHPEERHADCDLWALFAATE